MRIPFLALIGAATTLATTSSAQTFDFERSPGHHNTTTSLTAAAPNTSGSFIAEAIGGSLGSFVGIGAIALTKCHGEDLGCSVIKAGAGGVAGAIGATVGTILVAHHTNSRRSLIGAALGAVVGTGVGLGIHYAFNHNSDRNIGDPATVPIFVISQGTLSAIGSRMLGR